MESLENYAVADQLMSSEDAAGDVRQEHVIHHDYQFWHQIINAPDSYWNKQFLFTNFAFSEWVPRVPGLGFTDGAKIISRQLRNAIPLIPQRLIYSPSDKSGFVMSGVGSLKLPPDYNGYRLTCITSSSSSSKGIPILISPEVSEHHDLKNGDLLKSISGVWQKMTIDWVKHFAITELLPRGYLVVKHPNQIKKANDFSDFYYDPCSIMEYEEEGILKWDYVFCNVPVKGEMQQKGIQDFFSDYRSIKNIHGRYLINPDVGEPLFETVYNTPADLKTDYAQAQLALIKERMNQSAVEGLSIDKLTAQIAAAYQDPFSLRVFAQKCNINAGLIPEDSPVKMAVQIVHLGINSNLLLELVQRLLIEQNQQL